jgi:hypothetical protein
MRLTNRITCCLCLPNRVFFTLPLRAICIVIILATKRMAVQTCYSLLPSKLITRCVKEVFMATTLAAGDFTYKQELWVIAYSTIEPDSNKDNNSSRKRLESRKGVLCTRTRPRRAKERRGGEKKKKKAHRITSSVSQSINQSFHYQNQISFFPFCFTEAQKKKNQNASNPLRAKSK